MQYTLTLILLAIFAQFSFAQVEEADILSMFLHVSTITEGSKSPVSKNLRDSEALNFDVANHLKSNPNAQVRIFGNLRTKTETFSYSFDSKELEKGACFDNFCLEVIGLEKIPQLGVQITPMDDFSGVLVDEVLQGTPADESGISQGDVIEYLGENLISTACELTTAIADETPGDATTIVIERDGHRIKKDLIVGFKLKKKLTWKPCCNEDISIEIAKEDHKALSVYPNPTRSFAQFEFKTSSDDRATLYLTDIAGRLIYQQSLDPKKGFMKDILDLSKYPSGLYLINIEQNGSVLTEKLVLQRD